MPDRVISLYAGKYLIHIDCENNKVTGIHVHEEKSYEVGYRFVNSLQITEDGELTSSPP